MDSDDATSSWLTARPKALKALARVLGKSDYRAQEGSNTGGANGVYWVEIEKRRPDGLIVVTNLTEDAKIKVDEVSKPVEPGLLYPLLRGRDVQRWSCSPSAFIIMAQDPSKRRGIEVAKMQGSYPKTFAYLKFFEKMLRGRAAYRRYFDPDRDPFYSMFNISKHTFAPWKVVWREMASEMTASVIDKSEGRPVIPDHKLMLVECASGKEAHYLCAVLNSGPVGMGVSGYTIETQMNPHILDNIRIPKFDPKNKVHQRLSELSAKAHDLVRNQEPETKNQELAEVETEIDRQSAQLWGLTDAELAEIQRSLKELTG